MDTYIVAKKTPICVQCKKFKTNNDTYIEYKIPKCKDSKNKKIIHFCSNTCKDEFKKTSQCQVCLCTNRKQELINGFAICTDNNYDSDDTWEDKPTCKERYTGIFKCDFCDTESSGKLYCIDTSDGDDDDDYPPQLLMCERCFKPHIEYSVLKSHGLYVDVNFPNITYLSHNNTTYYPILKEYLNKVQLYSNINIASFIHKLYNDNEIDKLNEIYDMIGHLLNK